MSAESYTATVVNRSVCLKAVESAPLIARMDTPRTYDMNTLEDAKRILTAAETKAASLEIAGGDKEQV